MRLQDLLFSLALLVLSTSLATASVLVDFQVAQPPPVPKNTKQCTIQILQYAVHSLHTRVGCLIYDTSCNNFQA